MKPWNMLLLPFEETPPLVVQEISLELINSLLRLSLLLP